ncbi:uncharacterized protein K452DRAFT_145695 [Aplosporella prunicola CBS 121167]|uniref:Uncharacterized protein n=1 Tax=Aplosporella prunicola CBS 121167 TaxID=1176127 RepID=A0A6A6BM07_9PEZI|nr:uncharacterized protein K452DRAFT_145695 [Aplosporella prunicola CBS 121167]KAF2144708.1 hypothetical protein K452DRAFT_145695 [Aplosporella prunicola CBS 121167]
MRGRAFGTFTPHRHCCIIIMASFATSFSTTLRVRVTFHPCTSTSDIPSLYEYLGCRTSSQIKRSMLSHP